MTFTADSNEALTINEAVEMLKREGFDVSSHKLRQYEKQGLVSPTKSVGQHRLYKDSDLYQIRSVLTLIDLGFSLKEIKNYSDLGSNAWALLREILDRDNKFGTYFYSVDKKGEYSDSLGKEQHEDVLYRWTNLETNKNILILSKYVNFYHRILEAIDRKKRMLNLMSGKGNFEAGYIGSFEEILRRMQERVAQKPPY